MSCLFNSIAHFIRNEMEIRGIRDLRKEICDYISLNRGEKFGDVSIEEWIKFSNETEGIGKTVDEYLLKMNHDSQMGGGIELAVASRIFNLAIKVEHNQRIISEFNFSQAPVQEITLLYSGNHYDPKTDKVVH